MTTETQQSTVEWIEQEMLKGNLSMKQILEQAKEMEKQQIIDAWEDGHDSFSTRNAEQYYNETYGKQ